MNVKLQRSYRSKAGNITFVYTVTGSEVELDKFREIQGDFLREDEQKNPIWFTTRCIGDKGKLIITTNDKIVPDMSEYDKMASMVEQYPGKLGDAMAKVAAQKLLGNHAEVPETEE
jgi:hypothetical protein